MDDKSLIVEHECALCGEVTVGEYNRTVEQKAWMDSAGSRTALMWIEFKAVHQCGPVDVDVIASTLYDLSTPDTPIVDVQERVMCSDMVKELYRKD